MGYCESASIILRSIQVAAQNATRLPAAGTSAVRHLAPLRDGDVKPVLRVLERLLGKCGCDASCPSLQPAPSPRIRPATRPALRETMSLSRQVPQTTYHSFVPLSMV